MAKKKYIKDSRGMTVAVTTDTLGLEKPLLNENYDIDVHNRNMDKIDEDLKPIDDSYIIELFQHDGDTSRPRDYYTKEESDLKYATKEEVENIDLSNLATKEEANNALNKANEAFLRGDNVKTQLVDKLISEGLDVSTNNTFEELIGNIALGKKFAIGDFELASGTSNDVTVAYNFGFLPKTIILIHKSYLSLGVFTFEYDMRDDYACQTVSQSGSTTYILKDKLDYGVDTGKEYYVREDGFKLVLQYYRGLQCRWLAFE